MGFTIRGHYAISFTENASNLVFSEVESPMRISYFIDDNVIVDNVELHPDANGEVTIHVRQLVRLVPPLAGPCTTSKNLPQVAWRANKAGESIRLGSYLMPGGVSKPFDTASEIIDFFARNFLTHQPQIIETTPLQPQWLAFVRTYPYQTMELHTTLYTADGRTFTKQISETPGSYTYNQIDTSFSACWQEFCKEKDLVPIAYDVFGTSQKAQISDGVTTLIDKPNHPIGQRYLLRKARMDDQCFGFVNGMGGFDTLMMQGRTILKPEGDAETFTNSEVEKELANNYTSYWETSTGYIDSERMAAQYQDFLKSRDRWVCRDGEWHRIIVDEYKAEHTARELNAYTFKYHLAERNERRFYDREELPEPQITPGEFFPERG